MAIRRKLKHDDETRRRIKAAMLVDRLQRCALGELELTREQLRSCEILLRKVLPDLVATHSTTADSVISQSEWLRKMHELDPEENGQP